MDTMQIIRARLDAFLTLVNTNGALAYSGIKSFKPPNAYIDRTIYVSAVAEANEQGNFSTIGTLPQALYDQKETYNVTIELHWGTFENTETAWNTVETKNKLIFDAIKQSKFLLTGVHPDVGGTDIETGTKFDECATAQMQEFYAGDQVYPKGHTITMSFTRITAYSRDDANMKTVPGTPSTPELSLPVDGGGESSRTVIFAWLAATDAVSYTLQVGWDGLFAAATFFKNQSGITALTYTVAALDASYPIYWRVKATNANGDSLWSEIRYFIITLPT